MPVVFRCDHCQQLMSISRRQIGEEISCPRCEETITVPTSEQAEAAAQQKKELAKQETTEQPPAHESFFLPEDDESEELEGGFTLRRAKTDLEEMDLTPMVDVTFLLLIFFMVTASFSVQKSIEVPPPNPDQEGAAQTIQPLEELEDQSILVEIDEQNRFYLESELVQDPRDLPTLLAEVRSRESKQEIMITVAEQTLHESVVSAIDAAQEIGLQRIRWGVKPEE